MATNYSGFLRSEERAWCYDQYHQTIDPNDPDYEGVSCGCDDALESLPKIFPNSTV